jgi:microsomal dipeptidase-like Zn-dependent dipeptidase
MRSRQIIGLGRLATAMLAASLCVGPGQAAPAHAQGKPSVRAPAAIRPPMLPAGRELSGFVDMHAHPMSHLGFGRKAMHGAPDIGSIVPAGTRDCNAGDFRATTIEQALGHCNSTHGGWGAFDNTCGDYLRAGIINYALDSDFAHRVGFDRNPHGDHEHAGYPDFRFWPHQTSILHQQMWWEWLRRAYEGGLRVMVALTVNSELLAELINGDAPYDDRAVADKQIDETVEFVRRHSDFMAIAYSSDDLRAIVESNKMAVVLGMEVDRMGNFGKAGVPVNEAAVRGEVRRLHRKGVRYMFPIHLVDNSFGGSAVYEMLFNFANRHANGHHFRVETSRDPNVAYSASLTDGPLGSENALILGAKGFLEGLGQIPAPCFNDIRCFPPPGKILCCGSYGRILSLLNPTPELDAYKLIRPGHVNAVGLTDMGVIAINEMMKAGIIIDLDHMSERSMTSVIKAAEAIPGGGYPLVMGHNGIRGPGGNERSAPESLVRRMAALGGMFGVGTSKTTPADFVKNYSSVWAAMGNRAVGIGTDVNGFEPLPRHSRPVTAAASARFYGSFLRQSGVTSRIKTGNRTWDYILDQGVAHYGLMPEFLFDTKTTPGGGATVYANLMKSAEHFAQMWKKAELAVVNVNPPPTGTPHTYTLDPILDLCPAQRGAGDIEFDGHGPRVSGRVTLSISPDGRRLLTDVSLNAKETGGDGSEVRGTWTLPVGNPAPAGLRYAQIVTPTTAVFDMVLPGAGPNGPPASCDGRTHIIVPGNGPVVAVTVVGDTGGSDISTDNDCRCDTRIARIDFKPVSITLAGDRPPAARASGARF